MSWMMSDLSSFIGAQYSGPDKKFQGISTDTRVIKEAELFVALEGANFDGHQFIKEAESRGASAVMVSKPVTTQLPTLLVNNTTMGLGKLAKWHRQQYPIPLVGITGSCGKTTVREMTTSILSQANHVLTNQNNFNNEVGVPLTLLKLNAEHQYGVIEMGARCAGDIQYLTNIVQPQVSAITNISEAHIETFKSLEGTAQAKGEIYAYLQKGGTAVINLDEPYADYWKSLLSGQRVITFGLEFPADITCAYYVTEPQCCLFELVTDVGTAQVRLPIPGDHNIMNALTSAAIARAMDIPLFEIVNGLENFTSAEHRMQFRDGVNGSTIIDDCYNAAPASVIAALQVLSKQPGKKYFVFADMLELGENSGQQHTKIGQACAQHQVDQLLTYGEQAKHAQQATTVPGQHFADKSELVKTLLPMLDDASTVLVKGSNGMQLADVVTQLVPDN